MFFAADGRFVTGYHCGGVDIIERQRQFIKFALENQTRCQAAFTNYRVVEALLEAFDHYVKSGVTLKLIASVVHEDRVD